jgi:hypothetical protein
MHEISPQCYYYLVVLESGVSLFVPGLVADEGVVFLLFAMNFLSLASKKQ